MSLQPEEDIVAVSPEILEGPNEEEPKEPVEKEQPKEEELKEQEESKEQPKEEENKKSKEEEVIEPEEKEEPKEEQLKEPEEQEESKEEEIKKPEEPEQPKEEQEDSKTEKSRLIEPTVPKIKPLIYKPNQDNYDSDIECDPFSPFDYGSNEFSINRDQKQDNSKLQNFFTFISKKIEWIWK